MQIEFGHGFERSNLPDELLRSQINQIARCHNSQIHLHTNFCYAHTYTHTHTLTQRCENTRTKPGVC